MDLEEAQFPPQAQTLQRCHMNPKPPGSSVFLGQKENKVQKVHPAAYRGSGAQREVGPALMPLNQPGPRVGVPEAVSSGP